MQWCGQGCVILSERTEVDREAQETLSESRVCLLGSTVVGERDVHHSGLPLVVQTVAVRIQFVAEVLSRAVADERLLEIQSNIMLVAYLE